VSAGGAHPAPVAAPERRRTAVASSARTADRDGVETGAGAAAGRIGAAAA
jgi:hypothetical protein